MQRFITADDVMKVILGEYERSVTEMTTTLNKEDLQSYSVSCMTLRYLLSRCIELLPVKQQEIMKQKLRMYYKNAAVQIHSEPIFNE